MSEPTDETTRQKKLESYGLNCYLKEGLSARFLKELEKFSSSIYYKRRVQADYDWWMDQSRDRILDSLSYFDPKKGNIVSFVHSALRNVATNESRREGRVDKSKEDTFFAMRESRTMTDAEVESSAFFVDLAAHRGIELYQEVLITNAREGIMTPMVKAYLWLKLKGAV